MTLRQKRILALALFGAFSLAALLLLLPRRSPQVLDLPEGSQILFLGATAGTNQWNPAAPTLFRMLYRFPEAGSLLMPILPKAPQTVPSIAGSSSRMGMLWFFSRNGAHLPGFIVVRCLNSSGEEIGPAYNVRFTSGTNAVVVFMSGTPPDQLHAIRTIEVYQRGMPLAHESHSVLQSNSGLPMDLYTALDPIKEMDLYPGFRVGKFEVEFPELNRN